MPVKSLYPTLQLPVVDVYSFLFQRSDQTPSKHKVIFQDADDLNRQYTYEALHRLSEQFGRWLMLEYGLRKGERVAIVTPNDVDYPPVVLGILWAGGIVSPANPGYTVPELAYQIQDSGARMVVAHPAALDNVKQACARVGVSDANILLLGDPANKATSAAAATGIKHWRAELKHTGDRPCQRPTVNPKDDLAFLVYSSGTTGKPKGVMITHYNLTSNVKQITACEAGKLSSTGSKRIPGIPDAPPEGDKVLACLPFFHIYGLTSLVVAPIHNGIHALVLAKFEIVKFCQLIQDHRITFIYIVPPQALLLAKHPDVERYDLSSIRMTNSGAAPLTKELQQAVFARTRIRIKQGYGLSETSPTAIEQRWEDWNINIGTIGRLQPNMEAKFCEVAAEDAASAPTATAKTATVVTGNGDVGELPAGQIGELYLKGPNVFKGYWNNAGATAACLSADGWFRTGDVGYVDEHGDFFITDRAKELIKYKGFQVAPAELEGYLVDHELVDDVVVVGVESRRQGTEVPRAYVVHKGGMSAVRAGDDQSIITWLAARVSNHKKLRGGLKFVPAVPKSPSGKLLRRLLKQRAAEEFRKEEEEKEEEEEEEEEGGKRQERTTGLKAKL